MKNKNKKGFTLVELIVTIGVLMVFTVSIGSGLISVIQDINLNNQIMKAQQEARLALLAMSRDIHRVDKAEGIVITNGVANGNASDSLQITVASNPPTQVKYQLTGGILTRTPTNATIPEGGGATYDDSPLPFSGAQLTSLNFEWVDEEDGDPLGSGDGIGDNVGQGGISGTPRKRFMKITIGCPNGVHPALEDSTEFTTTLSVLRIPPASS